MADMIDVKDLDSEDVELVELLIERLRVRAGRRRPIRQEQKTTEPVGKEEYIFAAFPSNVIGKLTRKEIYEDR